MILGIGAVLGIALGLALGGSLKRLVEPGFSALYLPVIGSLLQFLEQLYFNQTKNDALHPLVVSLSYALVLVFLFLNRRYALGAALSALGTALNALVIAVNGFRMPVSRVVLDGNLGLAAEHILGYFIENAGNADAKLRFLGDIIRLPIPVIGGMISIGDVLLALGLAALCFEGMRESNARR